MTITEKENKVADKLLDNILHKIDCEGAVRDATLAYQTFISTASDRRECEAACELPVAHWEVSD